MKFVKQRVICDVMQDKTAQFAVLSDTVGKHLSDTAAILYKVKRIIFNLLINQTGRLYLNRRSTL